MFHGCFILISSWNGKENFRVGIFLSKTLSGLLGHLGSH